jgi:glycosyltransferase involved in cell wall biosynthesis
MPTYVGSPSVVTIHDLAYEYFPDLFLGPDLYKLKHWTRAAVQQATAVIAVSEATKKDLMTIYDVPENKISVVHNGYDSDIFNISPKISPQLLTNYRLESKNYLLFLGTIQPRKNAIKLVQAFHLLKQSGYKGKLVIAGKIGWLADDTLDVIKNSPEFKDIVLTGYVSDEARKNSIRTPMSTFTFSLRRIGVPVIRLWVVAPPLQHKQLLATRSGWRRRRPLQQ